MKRYGRPDAIITDRLRSYRAALRELGGSGLQQAGRWAEQSCGEFTPAVPATRTRHAPFQADAKPPEIRHRSFFRLQSLQPGTTPLLTRQFQAQPRRRTRRVASARGGLIPCRRWRTQSLRLSSDSAVPEPGLQAAGLGRASTPPRLARPLRLPARSAGNLRRHPTLHRRLLQGGQLDPCRTDPRARQTGPGPQGRSAHQKHLALPPEQILPKSASLNLSPQAHLPFVIARLWVYRIFTPESA